MVLLARLARRAEEVIRIKLDNIDWREGEFLVHGKGKRRDRLPSPQDVGDAIARFKEALATFEHSQNEAFEPNSA